MSDADLSVAIKLQDLFSTRFQTAMRGSVRATESMRRAVSSLSTSFSRLGARMRSMTQQTLGRFGAAWREIGTGIKAAAAAYIGWRGLQVGMDALKAYGNLQALQQAFKDLAPSIGASYRDLYKWDRILKGTAGHADILRALLEGVRSGLIRSAQDFDTITKAAFLLARTTGDQVVPTLQNLISVLAIGSTRPLRRLGIDIETTFRKVQKLSGEIPTLQQRQRLMLDELRKRISSPEMAQMYERPLNVIENLQRASRKWGDAMENIGQALQGIAPDLASIASAIEQLTRSMDKAIRPVKSFYGSLADAGRAAGNLAGDLYMVISKVLELDRVTIRHRKRVSTMRKEKEKAGAPVGPVGGEIPFLPHPGPHAGPAAPSSPALKKQVEQYKTDFGRLQQELTRMGAIGPAAQVQATQTQQAISAMQKFLSATMEGFQRWKAEFGDFLGAWSDAVIDTFRGLENSIGSVFFDAMMGRMKSFKDYLTSFIADISRAISRYFARALIGATFNPLLSAVGLPALQRGGVVYGPTTALIGEGGPEAVVPLKRGKIPVEITGGGQNVNLTFNINAVDGPSVKRMLYEESRTIEQIIRRAIGSNPGLKTAIKGA